MVEVRGASSNRNSGLGWLAANRIMMVEVRGASSNRNSGLGWPAANRIMMVEVGTTDREILMRFEPVFVENP